MAPVVADRDDRVHVDQPAQFVCGNQTEVGLRHASTYTLQKRIQRQTQGPERALLPDAEGERLDQIKRIRTCPDPDNLTG